MQKLALALLLAVGILVPGAAGAVEYTFSTPIAGDSVPVTLQLTDAASGGVDVLISIPAGQGDLLGLFGNVSNEALVPGMAIANDPAHVVTQWTFSANNVSKVGGGNLMTPVGNWDWGLRFGSSGSAGGAVLSASFRITGPGITVSQLTGATNQGWRFGVRIQSTTGPEGSAKIGLPASQPPNGTGEAPTIAIASPANGLLTRNTPVTVSGTFTGTAPVAITVSGVAATLTGSSYSASVPLVEGANTLTATATNAVGSASASVSVTLDTTPPVVTIETPADGSTTGASSVTVTGTVTDASPIASFTVNGVPVTLSAGSFTTTVSLALGANPISASATDAAGNTGSDAISVNRATPPTIAIASPANGLLTAQTPIPVSGTFTGTAPVTITVNGVPATITGSSYSASVPLVEGANTLTATATNLAGTASASVSVTLDTTPPVVTITSPPDGASTSASSVIVTGTVVDASPIASFTVNGQTVALSAGSFTTTVALAQGANAIEAVAVDAVGNTGSDAVAVTRQDSAPPAIEILTPAAGLLTNQTPLQVTGTVSGSTPLTVSVNGVAAVVTGSTWTALVPLVEGANTLVATATNALGSASDSVAVTLDTIPPVVLIGTPADGALTAEPSALVVGIVFDASPISRFELNQSATALSNGAFAGVVPLHLEGEFDPNSLTLETTSINPIRGMAVDAAGNIGFGEISVVRGKPPHVTLATPAEGAVFGTLAVDTAGMVSDAESVEIAAQTVPVLNMPNLAQPWAVAGVPLPQEGVNTLVAQASNGFGTSTAFARVIRDTEPPVVVIAVPQDGARTALASTPVSGTVFDASPITSFQINGQNVALVDGAFETTLALTPGDNPISAVAVDSLGHSGSDSVSVFRASAPTISIATPSAGQLFAVRTIQVTGSAPGATEVRVNGALATLTGEAWTATLTLPDEGENLLTGVATNEFGSAQATVTVLLDTTPPVVTILTPADGLRTASADTLVIGTVVDASPIASFTLNGQATSLDAKGIFVTTQPLALGAGAFDAAATDAAGNSGSDHAGVFRGRLPTITIDSPRHGDALVGASLPVSGAFTDADSLSVNGVAATLSGGTYSASLSVTGADVLAIQAVATNEFGSAASEVTVFAEEGEGAPLIDIQHPPDGALIPGSQVLVTGTINRFVPDRTTVAVNGVRAALAPNSFDEGPGAKFAVTVPIALGPNPIVATLTDDATAMDQISVTGIATGPSFRVALALSDWPLAGARDQFGPLVVEDDADYAAALAGIGLGPNRFDAPVTAPEIRSGDRPAFVVFAQSGGEATIGAATEHEPLALRAAHAALLPIASLADELASQGYDPLLALSLPPDDFTATHFAIFPLDVCGCYGNGECSPADFGLYGRGEDSGRTCPVFGPAHVLAQAVLDGGSVARDTFDFEIDGEPSRIELDWPPASATIVGGTSLRAHGRVSDSIEPAREAGPVLPGVSGHQLDEVQWFAIDQRTPAWTVFAQGTTPVVNGEFETTGIPVVAGQMSVNFFTTDAAGNSGSTGFTVTVNPTLPPGVASPPVITSAPVLTASEDSLYSYDVNATDTTAGDLLAYVLVEAPFGMTINDATGLIAWTPTNLQAAASYPVVVRVTDRAGLHAEQSFSVAVANVNDLPSIDSDSYAAVAEDQELVLQLHASDEDLDNPAIGEHLEFSLASAPDDLVIDASNRIHWRPGREDIGVHEMTLRVTDHTGAFTEQVLVIEVYEINDAPQIVSVPPATATEDRAYTYAVQVTDEEGGPFEFALAAAPSGMTIDAAGVVRYTPANADVGPHPVTIRVTDPAGAAAEQRYTLVVQNTPDPLVITSTPSLLADEDAQYLYDVEISDPDVGEPHTFSLVNPLAGMTIDAATGLIRWTPTNAQVGSRTVSVRVTDGPLAAKQQSFAIAVRNTNDAPTITSTAPTPAGDNEPYAYQITATDPDAGDTLQFFLVSGPSGMSVNAATGALTWTPGAGLAGTSVSVSVEARDAAGASGGQTFSLPVVEVNNAPFITTTAPLHVGPGATYHYDVDASDPDSGDTQSFSLDVAPAGMAIDASTGAISWTPSLPAQAGQNPVTVRVTDAGGLFGTQSFEIHTEANPHADFSASQAMNVAAWREGARVVEEVNGLSTSDPNNVLVGGPYASWVADSLPASFTADLAGEPGRAIVRAELRTATRTGARDVEVWLSDSGTEPSDFTLAFTATLPNDDELHGFDLPPTTARYAKVVVLSGQGATAHPLLRELRLLTRAREGGVVSFDAGGARIAAVSSTSSQFVPDYLIDLNPNTGWRSAPGDHTNAFAVIELAPGGPHWIDRVRFDSGSADVTVAVSTTGFAPADFTQVAAGNVPNDGKPRWLSFPPALARYVRLGFASTGNYVSFGDTHVFSGGVGSETVPFEDLSVDPGGHVVAWLWDFGDGATSTERNPTHVYAAPGTYTVRLQITDADGSSDVVTRPYTVFQRPNASFTHSAAPTEGRTTTFTDTSVDPDGAIVRSDWSFAGASPATRTGATVSTTFNDDSAHDVVLKVLDSQWLTGTTTGSVLVGNTTPTVSAGPDRTLPWGDPMQPKALVDDVSGDDAALTCLWEWGDGTTTTVSGCKSGFQTQRGYVPGSVDAVHSYLAPGTYVARLTVSDDSGASASDTLVVTATDEPRTSMIVFLGASPADASGLASVTARLVDREAPSRGVAGRTVTLSLGAQSGSATTDANGDVTVPLVFTAGGANLVYAEFAGDIRFLPSSGEDVFTAPTSFPGTPALGPPEVLDSRGREFMFAFPQNWFAHDELLGDGFLVLHVASPVATIVTVEAPGLGFGPASYVVEANKSTQISLPTDLRTDPAVGIQPLAVRVTALHEVTVQAIDGLPFTSDGFLALPSDALGQDYLAASYNAMATYPQYELGSQVSLVGLANGTQVTITPVVALRPSPATPAAVPANVPFTVTLNRFEVLTLESLVVNTDLTGSAIHSTAPIGVLGANQCQNVQINQVSCDHMVEMLPPISSWGTRFVKAAYHPLDTGDELRVMAAQNFTEVRIDGVPTVELQRGQVYKQILLEDVAQVIETSGPALVWQLERGGGMAGLGDPSMSLIPPVAQWPSEVWGRTPPRSGDFHQMSTWLNVVARPADLNGFLLNGNPLAAVWTPIEGSEFVRTHVPIALGESFHLRHRSPRTTFGAWQSGWATADSYAFPLGQRLAPLGSACEPSASVPGDGLDNDCDGQIDEETGDGLDQDFDGLVDEDLSFGQVAINVRPQVGDLQIALDEDEFADFVLSGGDRNGDALSFSVTQPPAHGTLVGTPPALRYVPTPDYYGSDDFRYVANDGTVDSNEGTYTLTVRPVNDPPTITSTPPATALEDSLYVYEITSTDPDAGDPVQVGLFPGSPVGLRLKGDTRRLEWTPTNADVGPHTVKIQVRDMRGGIDQQTFTITVLNTNDAPVITSNPVLTTKAGASYRYDVTASDVDAGDTKTFELGTHPAGMSIVPATGVLTWTSPYTASGTYPVTVRVRDAASATAEQSYDLVVTGDTTPPQVLIGATPATINAGQSTTITVAAVDDLPILATTVTANGVPLTLDANGQVIYTAPAAGRVAIVVTAADAAGNIATATFALAVRDPADTTAPTVSLDAPADDTEVTMTADVVGSVSDVNLVRWSLARQFQGETQWVEFASGATNQDHALLGTFDATQLVNGLYRIRLRAEDVNGAATDAFKRVLVEGGAKVGIYRISFLDMTIPLSGIPISVVRTYDSRLAHKSDEFGYGWQLDIGTGSVQNKHPIGDGWVIATDDRPFHLPCEYVKDQESHRTVVQLSDRERYVFVPTLANAQPFVGGCRADIFWDQVEGTTDGAELLVLGQGSVRATGTLVHGPNDPVSFHGTLVDADSFVPYEPKDYQLRLADGRVFDLNVERGVTRIEDSDGNEVFILKNGLVHSSGEQVVFQRDTAGRITRITDPAGKHLDYVYDAAGNLSTFTDRTSNTTTFHHDDAHLLTEIIDPLGVRAAQQEYDAKGRLIAVIDADGNRIQFEHDLNARIERHIDRLGYLETFEYDNHGNVLRQVDKNGEVWTWTYNDHDDQLTARDPIGNTTIRTFDGFHQLLTETNPLGYTRTIEYNAKRRPVKETDFDGRVTRYVYGLKGVLANVIGPDGASTGLGYDDHGNLTGMRDALGNITSAKYDAKGQLTSTTDANGHVVQYVYDANGNTLAVSETRTVGSIIETLLTRYEYDASNRLTATTDPLGNRTTTEYDAAGRAIATVDALGRRTDNAFDDLGRLVAKVAPDGTREQMSYDGDDQVVTRTDAAGRTTRFFYDPSGRPTRTSFVDGTESFSFYDRAGRVERVRDRRGNETRFDYDAAGQPTLVRDALGHQSVTAYDPSGRRISATDANGRTTSFGYDLAGQLSTTTFSDGSVSQAISNAVGQVTAQIDPLGRRTEFSNDARGRLVNVRDAAGGDTRYEYDALGNRTAIVDALGRRRSYEYDALGRITAEIKPLGQRATKRYDAVGNLVESADFNGRRTTYVYDALNRLSSERRADGSTVDYKYTLTGQLEQVLDSNGVTVLGYDDQDRLIEITRTDGLTLRYGYDAEGHRTRLETPSGTTTYEYDELGRLERIVDAQLGQTTFGYDANGNLTSRIQPNGVTTAYARDLRDRLTGVESRTSSGTLLSRYVYTLDASGNRTRLDEASGRSVTWQYDALYRLTNETIEAPGRPSLSEGYGYDAVGNRIVHSTSAGVYTGTYDANDRLIDDGAGTQYGYDANGNLTVRLSASGVTTFSWDTKNRLIEVSGPGIGVIEHVYDYADDLIETRTNGVVAKYLVDANRSLSQVVEERDGASGLVASYMYDDGGNVLQRRESVTSATAHYLQDGQTSVRQIADAGGEITDQYEFSAFGRTLRAIGSTRNAYRYAGQREDPLSQLYHLRARWMDPHNGQFASSDPHPGRERDPSSLHQYAYAASSPVGNVDPTGRFTLGEVSAANSVRNVLADMQGSIGLRLFDSAEDPDNASVTPSGLEVLLAISPGLPGIFKAVSKKLEQVHAGNGLVIFKVGKGVARPLEHEISAAKAIAKEFNTKVYLRGGNAVGHDGWIWTKQFEFKHLEALAPSSTTVKNAIEEALKRNKVPRIILDGREVGMTADMAREALARVEGKGLIVEEFIAILPGDRVLRLL